MVIYTIYRVARGHFSRCAAYASQIRALERADYLNSGIPGRCRFRYVVIAEYLDNFTG